MDPLELERLLHGRPAPEAEPDWEAVSEDPGPAEVPPDQGRAAWHNRRAFYAREQAAQVDAVFRDAIAEIQARRDALAGRYDREATWHERAVEAWHRQNVKAVGKTVKFPVGPASELRASRSKLVVRDEDKLRVFLHGLVDPETGETMESKVWRTKPAEFMVSELNRLTEPAKAGKDREPNEPVALVLKDTDRKVPGVVAITLDDRWQKGGK